MLMRFKKAETADYKFLSKQQAPKGKLWRSTTKKPLLYKCLTEADSPYAKL